MEVVLVYSSATFLNTTPNFKSKPYKTSPHNFTSFPITIKFPHTTAKSNKNNIIPSTITSRFNLFNLSSSRSLSISCISSSNRISASTTSTPSTLTALSSTSSGHQRYWMVVMEAPPQGLSSKPEIIDYYVKTLERVLGSEKDAQMCIYDASCETHFGFCCDIDEETSHELARLPGVLSVRHDLDFSSVQKDYTYSKGQSSSPSSSYGGNFLLFPAQNSKHWLVRTAKPAIGVITKAEVVDHFVQMLTKVLGNEKDAQMCMYHISWQSCFGFCCELDEECARELAGVTGVLSVQPDENHNSDDKNYGDENLQQSSDILDSSGGSQPPFIKTKKLFVAGLSFYTSEKTLRAAFECFGELVEVKIIMDKISKRSKGFAFIEYTTEAEANAALREMNGKIINGWMIAVDVAKENPPKYSRGRPRPDV